MSEAALETKTPRRARKPTAKPASAIKLVEATKTDLVAEAAPAPSTAVALATAFSPPELLHTAILQGADVEVIERLGAIAERWQAAQDARRAKSSFMSAMADAKSEMPTIRKNRHVKFKARDAGKADTDYWHEDLAEVVDTVQAAFGKHGLFFRWRTHQPDPTKVTITCILSHREGHSEETELTAAVDTSGNKNHIQAIKSASTYLERATLLAAAGVAARGQDDDGRTSGKTLQADSSFPGDRAYVTSDQITALRNMCKKVGCPIERFLVHADVATFEEISASDFDRFIADISTYSGKRG